MKFLSNTRIKALADGWFGSLKEVYRCKTNRDAIFGGLQEEVDCEDLTEREFKVWEANARMRLGRELSNRILTLSCRKEDR